MSAMKKITIGIIAHVDSGKTTLSEALLYKCGEVKSFGRVDKGESYLDGDEQERKRGITIYSKVARFSYNDTDVTLKDIYELIPSELSTQNKRFILPDDEKISVYKECVRMAIQKTLQPNT